MFLFLNEQRWFYYSPYYLIFLIKFARRVKKKGFYHKKKNIIIYIFSEFHYSLYLTPTSLQSSFLPIRCPGTVLSKFTNDLLPILRSIYSNISFIISESCETDHHPSWKLPFPSFHAKTLFFPSTFSSESVSIPSLSSLHVISRHSSGVSYFLILHSLFPCWFDTYPVLWLPTYMEMKTGFIIFLFQSYPSYCYLTKKCHHPVAKAQEQAWHPFLFPFSSLFSALTNPARISS